MKSSLRLFAFFAAAFLCGCLLIYPVQAVQAASALAPPDVNSAAASPAATTVDTVIIPGPLRSFLRMAGISQKASPEDVLPLFAHSVFVHGYQVGTPTEFLILVDRYVHQARELQILAGSTNTIRVNGCDDVGTLIQILGYRLRQGCGQKSFSLETANPGRAFLTIDSGFPLNELEEALQNGTPFTYSYPSTRVPVLFHENDWTGLSTAQRRRSGSLIDVLVSDPSVARLYWALAKDDTETRLALQRSPGLKALLPYASALDFYGGQLSIRSGHLTLPGGAGAQQAWKELVGASPDSPGDFVIRLLAKDKGWLALYFDALSRVNQAQQKHLTEAPRLRRLYEALLSGDPESGATKSVFRRAPELTVLFTRVEWDASGYPHLPGNLEVWKEIFHQKSDYKIARDWGRRAQAWDRPEQVLEGLVALSRLDSDIGPLQIYLMLSEIDRGRQPANRLSVETVRLLANRFTKFNSWYFVFTEFPQLDDQSITRFVTVAESIDKTSDQPLHGNALGSFQAITGLWQILARQGQIPNAELNPSWQKMIEPFANISSATQLFDAAHNSFSELIVAAGGKANSSQDEVVDLLAGPHQDSPDGQRVHLELATRISSVLEDQRLVSLNTLFALSDGMKQMTQGGTQRDRLLSLAMELREFDMPRPIFTNSEKISWSPTVYTNHHTELQVKTDLTRVIKTPGSPAQLEAARGRLAPFLRDTLVGLNYAYYEPPGAQMLHHNPLFVRSHDFLGLSMLDSERIWGTPQLLGAGNPAGGGGYLMGSLSDLSYALSTTEQDFIAPENVQALIWRELVPDLLVSATLPRWWTVTPNELHAATLYQRSGEELLTASAKNPEIRENVIAILSERMVPQRVEQVRKSLQRTEDAAALIPRMMPAETSSLAAEYRHRFPDVSPSWGPANQELEALRIRVPAEVSWERISTDFGVPHPTLARTNARELLNVKPLPFYGAYSSRLFGESWESSNLYWARLADESGYSPAALNSLVPELTRHMIAKIFATELEDWPALLRAMQETGKEFRQGKIASLPPLANTTSTVLQRTERDATAQ